VLSTLLLLALTFGDGDLVEDFETAGSEGWDRVISDTHPPYNVVERVHDPEQAKSGNQFLHFRTLGGCTAVRRSTRHPWPVEAGRPYRASVWVRLSDARRNSAFLSLTWVNAAGDVLAEQRSEPLVKTEGWTRQVLEVALSPAGATGVLPGLHFEGPDIRGFCDFDLLEFVPAELLLVRPAGRTMSMFTTDEYPRFTVSPSGLPNGVHSISTTITSPDGKVVNRGTTIDVPSDRSVAIDFPPLPPGIHQMRASVSGRDAWCSLTVLVIPPGWTLALPPILSGSAERLPESTEDLLQRRILDPARPIAPDRRLFDANGNPTWLSYALRIENRVLDGAEPVTDPGLFPAGFRAAAFRKGASALFAVWSEGAERPLLVPFSEGTLLSLSMVAPRPLHAGESILVGPTPLIFLDVNPLALDLRVDLSASELPLQLNPTRLTLRVGNRSRGDVPQDVQISFEDPPAGWRSSVRRIRIAALPPGSVHEETFDLSLPPSESERLVELRFDLNFMIRGNEVGIHTLRRVSLKSPIRLESSLKSDPSKTLSVRIVNGSDHGMTMSIRSRIPGLAERMDLIRDLAPGGRSKAFEFPVQDTGNAEILVQEAGGGRAVCRRLIPVH
jgi:hypothetical protein